MAEKQKQNLVKDPSSVNIGRVKIDENISKTVLSHNENISSDELLEIKLREMLAAAKSLEEVEKIGAKLEKLENRKHNIKIKKQRDRLALDKEKYQLERQKEHDAARLAREKNEEKRKEERFRKIELTKFFYELIIPLAILFLGVYICVVYNMQVLGPCMIGGALANLGFDKYLPGNFKDHLLGKYSKKNERNE